MSYSLDPKTRALFDLSVGGANLAGDAAWNLTANGDGTFRRAAGEEQMSRFGGGNWCVEREVVITSGPGTILELGAWGETEAVNIQLMVGWDADRRIVVGWEQGDGIDQVYTASAPMPAGVPLRIAVSCFAGRLLIVANGTLLVEWEGVSRPTGGGTIGSPTPGMTLAVGYRVSAADPQKYAGGGWLRISGGRTYAELLEDWEKSYSPPVPTVLAWEELARREGVESYYVFRGRYRATDAAPGSVVAWASAYVHTDDGLLEGRLLEAPGAIVMGIPEKPEAQAERTSASLVLDNADGALSEMFAGGDDPVAEYSADSLLSLSGKIYLGYVAPDGSTSERAITPTLVAIGSPALAGRKITIQLAADDSKGLGPTKKLVTGEAVRNADHIQDGEIWTNQGQGGGSIVPDSFTDVEIDFLKGQISQAFDTVVPFAWGRNPIPLTLVSDKSGGRYLAFVSFHEPDISWSSEWEVVPELLRDFNWSNEPGLTTWKIWSVKIQVERQDRETQQVWLVGVDVVGPLRSQLADQQLWLVPPARANVGMPSGAIATPVRIARQIITDLSERGGAAIHAASFARVDRSTRGSGTCGGIIDSGAPLSEILTHITGPWGIALWIDVDDQVHVARPTGWDTEDVEVAASDAPRVGVPDVTEGSLSERLPASGEFGGASARVSIDWDSRQVDFWEPKDRPVTAPGTARLALAGEPEARIPGAWLYPPASDVALRSVASRRSFVHRRVSVALPTWSLAYPLCSLIRLTHPFGASPGGYVDRLFRIVRREHMPGEDTVRCELLDLGAYEHLKPGRLDSAANWIHYDPDGNGVALIFEAGNDIVNLTDPVADPDWEGCSLWTFGQPDEEELRRSWRIVEVVSETELRLRETPEKDGVAVAATAAEPHLAQWIVMLNRTKAGPDYRPEYITVADASTGEHTDGEPAYVFTA